MEPNQPGQSAAAPATGQTATTWRATVVLLARAGYETAGLILAAKTFWAKQDMQTFDALRKQAQAAYAFVIENEAAIRRLGEQVWTALSTAMNAVVAEINQMAVDNQFNFMASL